MKYLTFEKMILACKRDYDDSVKRAKELELAFGGDSVIQMQVQLLDNVLDIISDDMKDENYLIDWLFWESINSTNYPKQFEEDGYTYMGTIFNVWHSLKGKLDKSRAINNIDFELLALKENIKLEMANAFYQDENQQLYVIRYLDNLEKKGEIHSFLTKKSKSNLEISIWRDSIEKVDNLQFYFRS